MVFADSAMVLAGTGQLSNLKELYLCCENLQSLPESKFHLRSSELDDRSRTVVFADSAMVLAGTGQLSNLKELNLRYCENLQSLPESEFRLRSSAYRGLQASGIGTELQWPWQASATAQLSRYSSSKAATGSSLSLKVNCTFGLRNS